jgi:putative ABC transport system permease protein
MIKGSPYEKTDPSIIFLSENDLQWLYVKIKPTVSAHQALPKIQAVFANIIPSAPSERKNVLASWLHSLAFLPF